MAAPLLGTTLVHMEILLETTTKVISSVYTTQSVGYLFGSLLYGFIFDRTNKEFEFTVAVIAQALATIVAPFVGHLYAFIAILTLQAVSQGFIDTDMLSRHDP